ncbi:MAG TPA: CheR family methyltransferase [Cellvibrio sp.]|nr:CheR family methyltransferase [Cellvibrio sp.]
MNSIELNESEFKQFQSWLQETTGINLSPAKKALVAGRLSKRLKHLKIDSYGNYFQFIKGDNAGAELQIAIDLLTTNETYFFREPKHFDFLKQKILTQLQPAKPFRVWSAASSSGEEAYSIAMTLADGLTTTSWEVFGSDISTKMLAIARNGHYAIGRADNIAKSQLSKYCLKGIGRQEGTFLIDRNLRSKVNFSQINLNQKIPNVGEFDLIFLRNVMIYFDLDTKRQVVARILPHLKSGGYLFVSHSESLNGICDAIKIIAPSIYCKP